MSRHCNNIVSILIVFLLSVCYGTNILAENLSISDFLRLQLDPKTSEPTALESSVLSLQAKTESGYDFSIDLVAAVHIADKSYFHKLNDSFEKYDQVLYELVARPEDLKFINNKEQLQKDSSSVSLVQKSLAEYLNLSFQLHQIDYSAKNFVHADMSPELLNQDMKDRGESFQSLFLKAIARSAEYQGQRAPTDLSDIFLLLTGQHSATGLKRMVARQFADMDKFIEALNGKNGNSIIAGRNQVVIDKLSHSLDSGARKYAVFYGAAHMPDLYNKLNTKFDLRITSKNWLKAWDLTVTKSDNSSF